MTSKLKPCPFCGGEASKERFIDIACWLWHISCKKCMSVCQFGKTEKQAVAAWNTRKEDKK